MGGGPRGPEVLWEEGCSSSLSNPPSRASIFFPLSLEAVVLGNETQLLLSVAHGRSPCCCLNTTSYYTHFVLIYHTMQLSFGGRGWATAFIFICAIPKRTWAP